MTSSIEYTPHAYQSRATRFICEKPRCALFLDMGLGKTVATLSAIMELQQLRCEVKKVLIIAPKAVAKHTWGAELKKWEHTNDLTLSLILGTAKERTEAIGKSADIYVTNRDNVRWLVSENKWDYDMVVLDESSSFKNPQSQRFRYLKKVLPRIKRLVLLTGTPSPNGLMDLWSQMYLLDNGARLGGNLTTYRYNYFTPDKRNGTTIYSWKPKPNAQKEITRLISDITLSMKAEEYLQLPDTQYINHYVTLSSEELRDYKIFEKSSVLQLESEEVTALSAVSLMNKLSQYAGGAVYLDTQKNYTEVSRAKLESLQELIESTDEPILVYYHYKSEGERLKAFLSDFQPILYDGRANTLERWNEGKIRVFLCQPQAMAYGLNMQKGGRIIIWYSLTWSLELYQQANARLKRQGQTKPVQVYHLLATDTIDEKIERSLKAKDNMQEKIFKMIKELQTEIKKN